METCLSPQPLPEPAPIWYPQPLQMPRMAPELEGSCPSSRLHALSWGFLGKATLSLEKSGKASQRREH